LRAVAHVIELSLRNFRNYTQERVELKPGVTLVHGFVGAGKTNLLEALCFACTARSPRTGNDRDVIRFGESATHVVAVAEDGSGTHRFEVGLERGRAKVLRANGVAASGSLGYVERPRLCVFMPDRLELVKGPASVRRTYLDDLVGALWPPRRQVRISYARALTQRNVLLARIRAGAAGRGSLAGWNRELARWGMELIGDRARAIETLAPAFVGYGGELGLSQETALRYRPRSSANDASELEAELEAVLDTDLDRGFTTHGPHRDDLRLDADGRELRRFGSQGQQRLALLALILAERDALSATGERPILLLDDVMSELDEDRRGRLMEVLAKGGQTLITTADPSFAAARLPGLSRLRVENGTVAAVG
jgi:DNA replication and repair protein RecF